MGQQLNFGLHLKHLEEHFLDVKEKLINVKLALAFRWLDLLKIWIKDGFHVDFDIYQDCLENILH